MARSISRADWHNEFDPFKTAYGGLSHSIFGKKLKEGRWYEEAISYRSDDAGWLGLV